MKRIIVPMGYMGSGSSAITDLISEFKDGMEVKRYTGFMARDQFDDFLK